jgi:hypothetical protein
VAVSAQTRLECLDRARFDRVNFDRVASRESVAGRESIVVRDSVAGRTVASVPWVVMSKTL